jgi:hypothetical protein
MRPLVGGRGVFVAWHDVQESHRNLLTQVRGQVGSAAWAVCKTVGLAYVGSNPTPATYLRE